MPNARDQMKAIQSELERVQAEISKLRIEEDTLKRLLATLNGDPPKRRKRAANVKPIVLEIMASAKREGATSVEVNELVREQVPTVAKDTVASVLSRLKSDGALVYDGERYYERRYDPSKPRSVIQLPPIRAS